jgi:glycosyltransferase involved in cell wall biosynthesis
MKIAIVIDSLGKGGAERQAFYMARELAARGCEVHLVHYYKSPYEFDDLDRTGAKLTLMLKEGRPWRFLWRLRGYLKRHRFDVVHAMKEQPCIYGCLAARLAGVPVIIAGYRGQFLSRGLSRVGIGLVNRVATAWITNSRGVAESVARGLGTPQERLHVVHNGIDRQALQCALSDGEARSRFGLDPDVPTVTIIAVLREEKNHEMFLRMAARVAANHPRCRFLLVGGTVPGDTATEPALRAMAARLGLGEQACFLGLGKSIPEVLAATDVLVLTSRHEGMSNALLEAMAVGVPVVATRYRGVEELVTDGVEGFLVGLDDDAAMADRVQALLREPALRSRMGASGRSAVESRFSLERMADGLLGVYRQYLGQGAPGGETAACGRCP